MKRRLPAWMLCALFCLAAPFQAQAGVIEWIDNLSGPGPFLGVSFEWRLVCTTRQDETSKEGDDRHAGAGIIAPGCVLNRIPPQHRRVASVNLQMGLFWDKAEENRLRYADETFDEKVRITTVEPSFWVRPIRGLETGSGIGLAWFTGPAFESFRRVYLKPIQVDLKPIALVLANKNKPYGSKDEAFVVRLGMMVFPEGFDSADFGALPGFRSDRDILFNFGFVLDLDPLVTR
jgi:hypothetical protein